MKTAKVKPKENVKGKEKANAREKSNVKEKVNANGKHLEEYRPSGRFAREISLWALLARGSIYKILTILVIIVSVEGALFYHTMYSWLGEVEITDAGFEWFYDSIQFRFERIFSYSGIPVVFLVAFWLMGFVLVRSQSETHGSRSGYTLGRLRVSGQHLFWVSTAYNFLCFALLFAVQILAALWMCRMYRDAMPAELVSPQFEFLTFYQIVFLHGLFPLAEIGKWVKNLLMLLALSLSVAENSRYQPLRVVCSLSIPVWWFTSGGIGFHWNELIMEVLLVALIVMSALGGMGILGRDKSVEEPKEA